VRKLVCSIVGKIFVGHYGEHDQNQSEEGRREHPHELEPWSETKLPHLLQVLAVLIDAVKVRDGDALEQADKQECPGGGIVIKYLKNVHTTLQFFNIKLILTD
jgi:hypothetical protein